MAMIMGPDRNRRHRIVYALSLRSRRAAGGLRRPSECRSLLAFPRTLYRSVGPGPTTNVSCEMRNSMMQCRTEDLKTSAPLAGIRGMGPSTSCRCRWIPSISSCSRNKFRPGRDHSTYVPARLEKERPSCHPGWTVLASTYRGAR